ncbi:MAG: TonB-dependent receptor plug domain-containing protein [Bacteroidales bacterium]
MKVFILFAIALLFYHETNAQNKTIFGQVTAFKSIPLNNITVISKNTRNSTVSDINGFFTIQISGDDVLTFESECFYREKKKMKGEKDTIKINLYFNSSKRNKDLAVANGHLSKDTLEYALANLPNQKEDYSIYTDIYTLIKAKFPFVQIHNQVITIEPQTFGTGSVLMLVDGNEVTDISFVQPRNVISLQVLKGPETSIYGMKGANGVIIIKTFGKD